VGSHKLLSRVTLVPSGVDRANLLKSNNSEGASRTREVARDMPVGRVFALCGLCRSGVARCFVNELHELGTSLKPTRPQRTQTYMCPKLAAVKGFGRGGPWGQRISPRFLPEISTNSSCAGL
jgi:hypothetical protein